jgi:mono/diheme cytochrome c family protein
MRNRDIAIVVAAAIVAFIVLALATRSASAADAPRGRALYESHCGNCHAKSVHGRRNKAASDFDSVRRWVARWSDNLRLGWSAADVDDVAAYLNGKYYRYPCPPDVCRALTQRS